VDAQTLTQAAGHPDADLFAITAAGGGSSVQRILALGAQSRTLGAEHVPQSLLR
jgi:hypothetical protein